ncbi:sugar-transfer associated ATP-grasp domain-containing protein [Aquisalimonas asiatica]|uniref:Sugar-transfer associated ATP-grasp n=1 Tax=Aquisalimonas asiatica TaxID=406100 RepID=A0A1H8U5K9_9GAMM|nr:sugar-transfer associated ATP-grasp domain-containing protein [Aquisalimonas asiatica]SEO98124.1 Sugar-transfer associated ATP-grasp [Aquisalimonas asiatica]
MASVKAITKSGISAVSRATLGQKWTEFLWMEWERSHPRPFQHPSLLLKGFFSQRARLYPLHQYPLDCFLSDWEIEHRFRQINPEEVKHFVANKINFHALMKALGLNAHLPTAIGFLDGPEFTALADYDSLEAAVEAGPVYMKPISGRGGAGVQRVDTPAQIPRDIAKERVFLVEAALAQHAYASAIYRHSSNTIKVLALKDVDTGRFFVAAAAQRIGTDKTAPLDNFKRGGLSAAVDLDTGVLSTAKHNAQTDCRAALDHHPDSGAPIAGTQVPYWKETCDLITTFSEAIPGLRMCGWDVLITEQGPKILEGCASIANPNLMQAHEPALLDRRVARFFEHHHVISDAKRVRSGHFENSARSPKVTGTH